MLQALRTVTLVIPDYDSAIAWYTGVLGFDLLEDSPQTPGKRWVVVAPPGAATTPGACQFLLARAATPGQTEAIGNQTGGRVAFFLTTNDFAADFNRLTAKGVHFLETPRHETYGWVVQFADPWGNKYDLLETPPSAAQARNSSVPPSEAQASPNGAQPSEAMARDSSVSRSEAHASLSQGNQAAGPSAAADARSGAPRAAECSGSYMSSGEGPATKQLPGNRPRRFGFVGILVSHNTNQGPEIQRILSDHADLIQGRMGLPHLENDTLAVITLIVRASPDELGSLTGRLGRLDGVAVKSGLAPLKDEI